MSAGFARAAAATTCTGELTDAPLAGCETQTEPADVEPGFGGGSGAGDGNGATPLVGPWLMVTGIPAHAVEIGVAVGVGLGVPLGVGVGVEIEGGEVADPPPQLAIVARKITSKPKTLSVGSETSRLLNFEPRTKPDMGTL